jgi:hypothetical protein
LGVRKAVFSSLLGLMDLRGLLEVLPGFTARAPDIFDDCANILGAAAASGLGWLILVVLSCKMVLRPSAAPRTGLDGQCIQNGRLDSGYNF